MTQKNIHGIATKEFLGNIQKADPKYPPEADFDEDAGGAIPDEWEDSWHDPEVFPLLA